MTILIAIIAVAGAAAGLTGDHLAPAEFTSAGARGHGGLSTVRPPISKTDKVDFVKDIQPVLQQHCIKCHGPEKQKATLRLDSRNAALEGGEGGPSLVAGDGARSELVRRISLPKTDDDFMPAEGEPLPKEQIALIKKWIDEGAVWPQTAMPKESANAKPAGRPTGVSQGFQTEQG